MTIAMHAQLEKRKWEKKQKFSINRQNMCPMLHYGQWLKIIYALFLKIQFFSDNEASIVCMLLHIILSASNDAMYHDFDTIWWIMSSRHIYSKPDNMQLSADLPMLRHDSRRARKSIKTSSYMKLLSFIFTNTKTLSCKLTTTKFV